MQVGNSRVKKILMGDKVVYQDSDGWIPLKLPDGVTGSAFFKDNNDGTASLAGILQFVLNGKPITLLNPPDGYSFTGIDWNADKQNEGSQHGIMGGNNYQGKWSSSNDVFNTRVANGSLNVLSGNYSSSGRRIVFLCKTCTTYLSEDADPALISIKKV